MQTEGREANSPRGMTIAWPVVAVILGVLTLTGFGTLAVVVGTKDVDTLSTVALALAVVSFAAQLIVTMAQAQQSASVAAETQAALTEMRATTSSLLVNQRGQFDTVLKALVQQAVPAAVDDVVGGAAERSGNADGSQEDRKEQATQLEDALQSRLNQAISTLERNQAVHGRWSSEPITMWATANPDDTSSASKNLLRRKRLRQWDALMASYPTKAEGEPAVAILRGLPLTSVRALSEIGHATREIIGERGLGVEPDSALEPGDVPGSRLWVLPSTGPSSSIQQLVDAGLIETKPASARQQGGPLYMRLTASGLNALRILKAEGEAPEWVTGLG